ncbi:MAG: hypothetical protein KF713_09610 [Turneriella sp.]|nr:hypothetical protein [Turneriella sp.]
MRSIFYALLLVCHCSKNVQNTAVSGNNLVMVGYGEISNISGDPNIDYLKSSIRDAGIDYMDKIFLYNKAPEAELIAATNTFATKIPTLDDQKNICNRIKTDVLLHSSFDVKGTRQKTVTLQTTVFRCDEGIIVETITNSAKINNQIFEEIQKIAQSIVSAIVNYKNKVSGQTPEKNGKEGSGEKIVLSKKSLKILPFIPPVF